MGRPEFADLNRADDRPGWNAALAFHLAMMVQPLAWCHGTARGGSPRLTGSTIDGRHFVKASHTDWASVCPDLTEKTVRRVLAVGVGKLPSGRRAGGLAITRRGGRGLVQSLDVDLLRRWYHEAGVTESRLTEPRSHHRPSFVRHDHDLCAVFHRTGGGGAMLGLMIRKLAWWQGSDQGHVARLKGIHLSDGYPYVAKTRGAWQLVHPVLTPRTAQRLLGEGRAAGFMHSEVAQVGNLNIGGLYLRGDYDALRLAYLQTIDQPPAGGWLRPTPALGTQLSADVELGVLESVDLSKDRPEAPVRAAQPVLVKGRTPSVPERANAYLT